MVTTVRASQVVEVAVALVPRVRMDPGVWGAYQIDLRVAEVLV